MTLVTKRFRIAFIFTFLLYGLCAFGQDATTPSSIHQLIQSRTDEIFDSLVAIRRDFHRYPEVSEKEERTSKKIQQYLESLGLEVKTNIGGYGLVGILKGAKEGKRIAWRADIDAISSDIPDVVDFESENKGVRHICGHDVNTTIALGIADVLSSLKENLRGTVYFIFQPSEENYKGAKAMMDDGLFTKINPEEIYASHITPMPEGLIATRPDLLFAEYRVVNIGYKKSGDNKSAIEYTKNVLSSLQNIKPDSEFWDNKNLLDPNIGLGNPNTVYKDYCIVNQDFIIEKTENQISISTIISSSNQSVLDSIIPSLERKIAASKYSENLIKVESSSPRPVISNHKELTTKTMGSISSIYGTDKVIPLYGVIPDGRGDDFAYFQKDIPGVYFLLGASNFEKGIISMPHSPNFAVDEESIKTGVNYFSSMIVERLKK